MTDSVSPPWHLLPVLTRPGAENMALDEAMSERARDSGAVLTRVYGWTRPTLSLGRHQRAAGLYDVEEARHRGVDIVRRPTGGRAVLHWREITYAVAAPENALGTLRQAYGAMNDALVLALRALGVDARVANPDARPPRPGPGACFEDPVAGEIVASGRKLVGSAQHRADGALLQHGSILIDDDQSLANALLVNPQPAPPPAATLRSLMSRAPSLDEFDAAWATAIAERFGHLPCRVALDEALEDRASKAAARYASDGWTWRR